MKKNIIYLAGALLSSAILTFGCSEDIPSYNELTIDKTAVFIQADGDNPFAEINITNGNGNYKLTVADENIASATLDGNRIIINGLKDGTTTATVMDWSKHSAAFTIKVKEDFELKLDKEELVMFLDENKTALVNIISGNGGYQVESSNNEVATAEINEDGKILVTALSSDFCNIIVTDADGNKTTLKVRVCVEHLVTEDITKKVCEIGKELIINITSGNGEYSVASENPEIATADMTEDAIKVTGVSKGEVNITVTDRMKLTHSMKVRVTGGLIIEMTQIDNVWIGKELRIPIIDGSGHYTIECGSSMTGVLSEDKQELIVNGIEKKMALNQEITITDNILGTSTIITVKCIDYPFEKNVARWFIQDSFGIPGGCSINEANGITTIKAGDQNIRNGFVISFKGDRTEGNKTNATLYTLDSSGQNGSEIKISNVVMEKVQYDEGREPNGFFWIKFREDGKDYDSYIIAHT
ncbi:MAG TPA: Ig-like domain-containing protein [Candidatus Bacteroides intestinigallinarum]|nr:Ig-like domain-containing protein [Candidatus Bacteroides intestinigallinarum]